MWLADWGTHAVREISIATGAASTLMGGPVAQAAITDGGGMVGPGEEGVEVCTAHGDMTDLAARADVLAVHVHLQPRVPGHDVPVGAVHVGVLTAQDVDHHREGGQRRG